MVTSCRCAAAWLDWQDCWFAHLLAHCKLTCHTRQSNLHSQEEYMEKAQMMLKKAGRRLSVVSKQSRSFLMLWVVLFGIGLFIIV